MTMRILPGQKCNLLERGIVTVTSEHAQLGRTRLYDGRPSRAWRSASLAADQTIRVDGNLLTDGVTDYGGFESWSGGSPVGWTETPTGTGDVTQEGAIVNSGASSAKFTGGTGTAGCYRDVVVKAGEIITIASALRGDGTAGMRLYVENRLTHKYLVAGGGSWGAVQTFRNEIPAAWSATEVSGIVVEDFAACQSDLVTLRLSLYLAAGGATTYADDVRVWPRVNFGSIHGHNLDPGQVVTFRSSTDAWAASDDAEATAVNTTPSFYTLLTAGNQDRRYWGFKLAGVPSVYPEIGELVIGYARTPLQQFENPLEESTRWDRQLSVTPGGERHVHKRSKWQIRNRVFLYTYYSQAEYDEGIELFHLRPAGDTYPVVIVPDHDKPTVIHGRLESTFSDARDWTAGVIFNDVAVALNESPFASTAY